MVEKPPLLYDVVYPKDFTDKIKKIGKYDVLNLARNGMVICFEIIQPKDKIDLVLKQVASAFHVKEPIIFLDIDEWVKESNTVFNIVKNTKKWGETPLKLFITVQFLTDVYSKERRKELDEIEQKGGMRPSGGYVSKPVQIVDKEAEKKGWEHWLLFVSTHNYLVEGCYLDTLLETHRKNAENLLIRLKRQKKRK